MIASALAAALASLLLAASAPAVEESTIFTIAPAMHARGVTVGPDGNLWFAAASSASSDAPGAVGKVTPSGEVTEFPLTGGFGARSIVPGPDGNLWFTKPQAGSIGRITPAGELTAFPLKEPWARPGGIAVGADGNLWFGEESAGRIGRITPAGTITEFPLGQDSRPDGVSAGPDGNIWFTDWGFNRIGRITPGGAITTFPVPGSNPRPDNIIAGPDGNLWFTLEGASQVGRITPAGELALFPVPTLTGTHAIVAGADGNIWFSAESRVGAIAPSGRLARLSCLKAGCRLPTTALATGPGGEIWAGTSTEFPAYGGGGTYINVNLTQPGYIARFAPRASTTEIGTASRRVKNRRTRIMLTCGTATGCHGVLRLIRQRAVFPGESGANFKEVQIGRGRYDLLEGERRAILVGLNRKGMKLRAKGGPVIAWAMAGTPDGDLETARLVNLARPSR